MSRIYISQGNQRRYPSCFYPFYCVECTDYFPKGSPVGYVADEGPYCDGCLSEAATPTHIEVTKQAKER